jgi:DNA-directed RNA polymerase specialized sigma24 family protein
MADDDGWPNAADFVQRLKARDNDAWRLLEPHVRRLAQRLVRHPNQQLKTSFVDGALREVQARIDGYDPAKGHSAAWCAVVLRRVWIDFLKEDIRHRRLQQASTNFGTTDLEVLPDTARDGPSMQELLERAIDAQDEFPAAVVEKIAQWRPARDRVLLMCIGGCWRKVPKADWDQWLAECDVSEFSDQRLAACVDYLDRQNEVARLLGYTPAAIHVIWCRKKQLLADLTYFKDLWTKHG